MVKLTISKLKANLALKQVPSNKKYSPGISSGKQQTQSVSDTEAPVPFIDKISVVWAPAATAVAKSSYGLLLADAQSDDDVLKVTSGSRVKGFNRAWRVALENVPDVKKWPLLHASLHDNQTEKLRLEFVPVDLGFSGLAELHAVLGGFIEDGWNNFVKRGKVTRIDVAVDFPHLRMDQLLFLPKPQATTRQWARDGQLQTFVQGSKFGSQLRIYSRKAKRKAQGKSWKDKTGVRIERAVKPGKPVLVKDLPALPNPFDSLTLMTVMPPMPEGEAKPYIWELFKCAVEQNGIPVALGLLPEDKRKLYRDHLDTFCAEWWDPEEIWKNWLLMLDDLSIADQTKWG
jgi:hypothetical protein